MNTFLNVLPIDFGGGVCHALRVGFETDLTRLLAQHPDAFAHHGLCLTLQAGQAAGTEVLDPGDLEKILLPRLGTALASLLAELGQVETLAEGFRFCGKDAIGRLELYLAVAYDSKGKGYHIVIHALQATDKSTDFEQFRRMEALLSGRSLAVGGARIGALTAVPMSSFNPHDLLFSVDGTQHHQSAREGIVRFGPYSSLRMCDTSINLLVFVDPSLKSSASRWLQDLKNGREKVQMGDRAWRMGMSKYFRFEELALYAGGDLPHDAGAAALVLDKFRCESGPTVVFYVADQDHLALEGQAIARGLPCHRISPQDLQKDGDERDVHLFDQALMLYAKCQGEPWLLHMPKRLEHELVIGVGSHPTEDGVRGYATVFSSQGNYKLGDANWKGSAADWAEHMGDFVIQQLQRLPRLDGWKNRSKVSLLFHFDQRPSDTVLQPLRQCIDDVFGGQYELHISYLLATYDHPYQIWDKTKPGLHQRGRLIGKFQPKVGTVARLATGKALLQMVGPESASQYDRPLLVESLPGSEDRDFNYQLDQVFYFRQFSWRSVQPAALPVTLAYGTLVAEKCHKLHAANPYFTIPDKLQNIPWYL